MEYFEKGMFEKNAIIVMLMLFTVLLAACNDATTSTYETIEIDQVEAKMKDGYTVLDVREIDEYEEGHIVGAVNKPLSELKKGDIEGLDASELYVVICRSGNRSKEASEIMVGKAECVNVSEGMSA